MKNKGFQYALHSVKKLDFYLNSPDSAGIENIEAEKKGIKRSFQMNFDYTAGLFSIKVMIDYLCRIETPEPVKLFGATILCQFKFTGHEEVLLKNEKDQVDIPDDLLITLLSLTYSTARGVLASETAGTVYEKYVLPLVSIEEFKKMIGKMKEKSG